MMRRHVEQDRGASLVIVIVFVFVLAVILGSVASFADAGIRSAKPFRELRSTNYALDAAVSGAIRQVRRDLTQGVAPGYTNGTNMCDDYNAPATNGLTVTVSCQGEQGVQGQYDSGGFTPAVNPDNVPPVALQTTANTGEPGVALDANGSYRIHGSVQASSSIRSCTNSGWNTCSSGSASSALLVEGRVTAQQCIGDIRTFGPPYPTQPGDPPAPEDPSLKDCPGGVPDAVPAYMPSFSSPPATRSVPPCPATGYLVTLLPGTYTSAAALNALTAGACPGKIVWFKPGAYLFDFRDAGSHEWTLNDSSVNVVGGTPFGWNPAASSRPTIPKADSSNPAVHACTTEYDALPAGADPDNLGVEFAFTGDSRINIQPAGGNLELCAQPSDDNQQIALLGMPVRGNARNGTLGATSVLASSGFGPDLDPSGLTIDGLVATGTTPAGGNASVTFAGYQQLDSSTLPADAVITRVLLKVQHREGPTNGAVSAVSATVTSADGTALPVQPLTKCVSSACVDTIDLTRYFTDVSKIRTATGGSPGVSYAVAASSGKTATGTIDGAALDVHWVPKSAVATAVPSPPGNVANPSQAISIDGSAATVTVTSNATTTVSLTGYDQLTSGDLPAGAVITKVTAHVVHQEFPANVPTITLTGTAADGSPIPARSVNSCAGSLLECTQTIDLTSTLNTVAKLRNGSGGGVTLRYNVKGKNSATAISDLDGIRLDVTYAPDSLGSAQGCMAEAPYSQNDSGTCALLRAQGNNAFVSLHGTIYAPSSAVDLKIMNGGTTIFGRGALVRTLRLFFNPSVVYSGANITIETPDYGSFTRHDRIVDFWACPPRADGSRLTPCDNSNARLHVVASFADTSAGTPVTIKLWSRRR